LASNSLLTLASSAVVLARLSRLFVFLRHADEFGLQRRHLDVRAGGVLSSGTGRPSCRYRVRSTKLTGFVAGVGVEVEIVAAPGRIALQEASEDRLIVPRARES
jgi:hypothetical protein